MQNPTKTWNQPQVAACSAQYQTHTHQLKQRAQLSRSKWTHFYLMPIGPYWKSVLQAKMILMAI